MDNPFFSIIIPTYNRENFIQTTIDSVLNQTYGDFELIIIDNQSEDATKEIIQKNKDKRLFFYENEKNFERCYSRNRGVTLSKGKFVLLLDSDDFYEEDHLSNWYFFLEDKQDNSNVFYVSDKKIWRENGVFVEQNVQIKEQHPVNYFFKYPIIPGQVCIPIDLIQKYQFRNDLLIFEDAAMWMELALKNNVVFNAINSFRYRIHGDNSVNEEVYNAYYTRLKAVNILLREVKFLKFLDRSTISSVKDACYMGIIRYHEGNSSRIVRFYWVLKSIILIPTKRLKNKILILLSIIPVLSNLPFFKKRKLF